MSKLSKGERLGALGLAITGLLLIAGGLLYSKFNQNIQSVGNQQATVVETVVHDTVTISKSKSSHKRGGAKAKTSKRIKSSAAEEQMTVRDPVNDPVPISRRWREADRERDQEDDREEI